MTFSSEVHQIVNVVFRKKAIGKLAVTNVTLDKNATLVVDIIFQRSKVSGIGERIEHHHAHVIVFILFIKQIFYIICADETGCSCYEISFHFFLFIIHIYL